MSRSFQTTLPRAAFEIGLAPTSLQIHGALALVAAASLLSFGGASKAGVVDERPAAVAPLVATPAAQSGVAGVAAPVSPTAGMGADAPFASGPGRSLLTGPFAGPHWKRSVSLPLGAMALDMALRSLLRVGPGLSTGPGYEGITLRFAPDINPAERTVSQTGERGTVQQLLHHLLAASGTMARLDGNTLTIEQQSAAAGPNAASVIAKRFQLKGGERIDHQLARWAKSDGWDLIWSSQKTWIVPGTNSTSYEGGADRAVEAAIRDLYSNGIPVRLDIWEANRVMEVNHAR